MRCGFSGLGGGSVTGELGWMPYVPEGPKSLNKVSELVDRSPLLPAGKVGKGKKERNKNGGESKLEFFFPLETLITVAWKKLLPKCRVNSTILMIVSHTRRVEPLVLSRNDVASRKKKNVWKRHSSIKISNSSPITYTRYQFTINMGCVCKSLLFSSMMM
ncbi:hypothetical protein CEXT_108021 [Caerostris extrusa]|uniref:Uncharacterized protein n=1 Tax=Caerostris extrusa TaxID=172846 RepID=A0AAV4N2H7_CAEEX|nr:hypothetical protein CEXT_108021 [Caerostris extrusa]